MTRTIVPLVLVCLLLGETRAPSAPRREQDVARCMMILQRHPKAEKRKEAAEELADIAAVRCKDARPAIPVLLVTFEKDADGSVRIAAAEALSLSKPDPKVVLPVLLRVLKNESETTALLAAAVTLAGALSTDAKEVLPVLDIILKRENDKPENERDGNLLQAINQAMPLIQGTANPDGGSDS